MAPKASARLSNHSRLLSEKKSVLVDCDDFQTTILNPTMFTSTWLYIKRLHFLNRLGTLPSALRVLETSLRSVSKTTKSLSLGS